MPVFSDNPGPNVIRFLPDRARTDDPYVGELLKGIVGSVKELEERNRALEEQNNELLSALRRAHERIDVFERSVVANPKLTRLAFSTAAQLIESAQESIEAARRSVKESSADLYEETIRQVIDHEKRALTLLEGARRETDLRKQEVDHSALEAFLQAKDSILSMARDLDKPDTALDPEVVRSALESGTSFGGHERRPAEVAVDEAAVASESGWRAKAGLDSTKAIPTIAKGITHESALSPDRLDRLETPSHTIELAAAPFRTFAAITSFHRSILHLPGVSEVKVSGFSGERLHLVIKKTGPLPLVGALMGMDAFDLQLVSFAPDKMEFRVGDNGLGSAPAARDTASI